MQDEIRVNENELSREEREIEAALAALCPARPTLNRDVVLLAAVRATERRRIAFWRGVAGVLAACLAAVLVFRRSVPPQKPVIERIVVYVPQVPRPESNTRSATALVLDDASSPGEDAYIAVRDRVLRRGLVGLRSPESLVRAFVQPPARNPAAAPLPEVEKVSRQPAGPIYRALSIFNTGDSL